MKLFNDLVVALLFVLLLFNSCSNNLSKWEKARHMADKLVEDIGSGMANSEFPINRFPPVQVKQLILFLDSTCDFKNRQGLFINDFYVKQVGNGKSDNVFFIYEYHLKCDDLRLILGYDLGGVGDSVELVAFRVEKTSDRNPMITKPERCLKNR